MRARIAEIVRHGGPLPKSGRKASAFQAGDIKAPLVFPLPFVLESLVSTRPMAGHGQKSSSLSYAEVGRLWEEPTEETSQNEAPEESSPLAARRMSKGLHLASRD